MFTRSVVKRLSSEDRSFYVKGCISFAGFTGLLSYSNYRQWITKDFLRSEGHHRLNRQISNITPWQSMYFTWFRMPRQEYEMHHKFVPYYMIGQLDYTKEILIPEKKNG